MEHLLTQEELLRSADSVERATWLGYNHDQSLRRPAAQTFEANAEQNHFSGQMLLNSANNLQVHGISEIALLQSFSVIGIWEVLLRRRLSTTLFLIGFCPGATFSTQKVPLLLTELRQLGSQQHNSAELKLKSKDILYVLEFLSRWDGILAGTRISQFSHVIPKLRRQIVLMREAIQDATRQQVVIGLQYFHTGNCSEAVQKRLYDNGHCPSKLKILEYMGWSSLEYFLLTGRNDPDTDVTKHNSCCWQNCVHQEQNRARRQVRHVKEYCLEGCYFITGSLSFITRIINSGGYFVFDVSRIANSAQIPDDAIVPYVPGLQYAAFSHVWAHGLASDSDTGLPVCQLRKLQQILEQANFAAGLRTRYFWLDSLCIPQERELKMRSIAIMDQIYKNAAVVIALDAVLETISYEDQSQETCALYIITSDWNQRLWTFQEAKLAKRL